MTLKVLYSSILILILSSCVGVKTKLILSAVNGNYKHSRAIDVRDESFVVAGQNGVITFFEDNENAISDSLFHAEDVRDIKLLKGGAMIMMNSGENGIIWKSAYVVDRSIEAYHKEGVFLDGMAFWDDKNGVAYGDPVDGKFIVLITEDMGMSWAPINEDVIPYALPNEAGFAASGTGIAALGSSKIIFATGMADTARLYISEDKGRSWTTKATPIKSGDTYGIYSMYFWSENEGVVVGGSYKEPDDNEDNCFLTLDSGDNWHKGVGLGGYISCIHGTNDGSFLVATGRVGTYYSVDRGRNWKSLFKKTFYSVHVSDKRLYFSGKDGVIEVYDYTLNSKN